MSKLIYADLTYEVRGALFAVYNELRHLDLSEAGWERALLIALQERTVSARQQVEYELRYKGYRIGRFFVDLLVAEKLVIELKATASLRPLDEAQLLTYLRVTGLQLGLLVNFGGNELEIKRIPNFIPDRPLHPPAPDTGGKSEQWLYPANTVRIEPADAK